MKTINPLCRLAVISVGTAAACAFAARAPAVCPPPTILQQPADLTIVENQTATFSVVVLGTAPITYGWSKDGTPLNNGGQVSGADAAMLTYVGVPLTESGSHFQVRITDACGAVTSLIATLTVIADIVPPTVVSATARCLSNQIVVAFSEPVDPTTAAEPAAYSVLDTPLTVESAALLSDHEVWLTVPGIDDWEGDLTLAVFGVLDRAHSPNSLQPDPSLVPIVARCKRCGRIVKSVLTCRTNPPGTCTWSFEVQNLSTSAVKYLFLTPRPPCFTVAPEVQPLPSPLLPGQIAPLSVTFSNVSPDCGRELCLLVSLHDSSFVRCCAFTNCLPNPLASTNTPPTLHCPDPVRVCTRGTNAGVTLTAQAGDPDGDTLSVEWRVDGVVVSTSGLTLTYVFPLGTHTVQVTVSDGQSSAVCTTTVTVLPAPIMKIVLDGKDVVLTWTSEGVLQCATEVTGPWSDVPGATSPYRVQADGRHRFYRVRCHKDG
jgi:hypothetical protein